MSEHEASDPPLRILVTDDSADQLAILTAALEDPAHDLLVAKSGESALRIAQATPPDLVLLDVRMPGMDGYETCRRLHDLPGLAELPVIFVSGLDHPDDRATAFRAGGSDYLVKPYAHEELRGRVAAHLVGARLRRRITRLSDARGCGERIDRDPPVVLRGGSAAALALREAVAAQAGETTVVVEGALTDGALQVAVALHERHAPTLPLCVVTTGGELPTHDTAGVWVECAAQHPDETLAALPAALRLLHATSSGELAAFGARVVVPPWSSRFSDQPEIVDALATAEARRWAVPCLDAPTRAALAGASWPGGLAEIAASVRARTLRRASGDAGAQPSSSSASASRSQRST